MSSVLGEMLKSIRTAEGLTQAEFADITSISISTIKKYETGNRDPGGNTLLKLTKHPRFSKYTMWLMTGETNEVAGQISPALSPDGPENTSGMQEISKTG